MGQPILYQIRAWDAITEGVISFSYVGNQAFKNQVIIRINETNVVVYDQTHTTFQLKHTIAANTLQNNTCYNIQLRVFDKDDTPSPWSKTEVFYCFSSAIFKFSGIEQNQMVNCSSLETHLIYEQPHDPINYYQFFLYDEQKTKIAQSSMLYGDSLKYVYSGLEDKKIYYIRATGETINLVPLDTGYIAIAVSYSTPSYYAMVELTNVHDQGMIRIHSNMVSVEGTSNPSPPKFVDKKVDLVEKNSWVKFDRGYEINGNFTAQLDVTQLIQNNTCLVFVGANNTRIVVEYKYGQKEGLHNNEAYFKLNVETSNLTYVLYSNYIPVQIADNEQVNLWIRKKNNLYEIKAVIKEVVL